MNLPTYKEAQQDVPQHHKNEPFTNYPPTHFNMSKMKWSKMLSKGYMDEENCQPQPITTITHTFTKVNKMPNTSNHGKCVNKLLEEIMNALKMEKHL